jgi:hypothetical protein
MATNSTPAPAANADRPDPVAANYNRITTAAVAGGVLLIAVAGLCLWLRPRGYNALPYALWAAPLGLFELVVGALGLNRGSGRWTDGERGRTLILAQLGAIGLATAVLGLTLPFAYTDVFGSEFKVWQQHMGKVLLCGGLVFGGMLVMLAGLQLSRGFGLAFPNLRRTVFGYNALLGSALLLCILGLINLLPYIRLAPFKYLNETYDWTKQRLYSLAPASKSLLGSLSEPVKVKVILSEEDPLRGDVMTLLDNCKEATPKLDVESIAPEYNQDRLAALAKKYQIPSLGLLVLYGTEPNETSEFIRKTELFEDSSPMNPTERKRNFTGEFALMKALDSLTQGKSKIIVYFTQSNDETPLEMPRPGGEPFRETASLSSLSRQLEQERNMVVKPLKFDAKTESIPGDASVVALVAPTKPFKEETLKMLRDYLSGEGRKTKGHLVVLLGPASASKEALSGRSLESFLAEYDVRAGNDRVLSAGLQNPQEVLVISSRASTNALARSLFAAGRPIPYNFVGCRTVSAARAGGGPGRFSVESLLYAAQDEDLGAWAETNLEGDAAALAADLRANPAKLDRKRGEEPLSVAVTVTEVKESMPQMPPGHPPMGGGESQPRLVVFGSASWAANRAVDGRGGRRYLDLFASSLSWLRERPNLGEAARGKDIDEFSLPTQPGGNWRLVLLPGALLLLSVVMLGSGIWVVRRR